MVNRFWQSLVDSISCIHIFEAFLAILFVVRSQIAIAEVAYTSRSAFDAAAGVPVSLIDFEAFSVGNVNSGASLGGLTFDYSLGSVSLRVTDSIPTTSGTKSLGTDDRNMLLDGDNIDFSFAPRSAFGLYVTSSDALINGDVRLTVNGTFASLVSSAPQINLGGGRFAWFLGLQSSGGSSFTSASLTTHGGGGAFNYNLDDFVSITAVPEPSSLGLLSLLAGLYTRHRGRRIAVRS